jgi:hypothetical protein
MKKIIKLNLILFLFSFFSCDLVFLKPSEFKSEFEKHTTKCNSILFDGDFLHPRYVFIKNGKIKGIEFNATPECGKFIKRYFLDDNEKITKIIIEKDFHSEHCGKPFDSLFVIELPKKQVKIYTKSTNGKIIFNNNLIKSEMININEFKNEIKKWRNK